MYDVAMPTVVFQLTLPIVKIGGETGYGCPAITLAH